MGSLYTAVNHSKRQAFELGKAFGFALLVEPRPQNKEEWYVRIRDLTDPQYYSDEQCAHLAHALNDLDPQEVFSDSSEDDELYCDYVYVGTIYEDHDSQKIIGTKVGSTAVEYGYIPESYLATGHPQNIR